MEGPWNGCSEAYNKRKFELFIGKLNWILNWVMNNVDIIGDSVRCEICCLELHESRVFTVHCFIWHTYKCISYVFCLLPQTSTASSKYYDVQHVWQPWLSKLCASSEGKIMDAICIISHIVLMRKP
jgi:hypothetical protein